MKPKYRCSRNVWDTMSDALKEEMKGKFDIELFDREECPKCGELMQDFENYSRCNKCGTVVGKTAEEMK